ncbi:M15 family metallopeptidase [Paenibacillus sp. FSL R7-0331]|uniref:M15 family metallopeptidase n=1 Tax=Paenibacillus sp. FSL R7-0331 TaxID=1536773 RepID=UPI0004F5E0D9|nr:M15 family metallopeptidase [Paenibacillus sp. FSL R7-0331]AIQ54558.1 peptidase M15 [Paenibacillus sp. FSL R7-0331]
MLTLAQVKLKSQARLVDLHPVVVAAAVALIERSYARGVQIIITQGYRSKAEQDGLYAQGRTKPGSIVTNARGGYSYHNYGLAVDFALLLPDGYSASWDMKRDGDKDGIADWQEVAQQAKALGFEWGGDWMSFKDYPHFQMSFGLSITKLLAGAQPTPAQTAAAYAVIDKLQEEADELSQAEKQELAALRSEVKELKDVVAGLTKSKDILKDQALQQAGEIKGLKDKSSMLKPPAWAQPAIDAAVDAGLLDTPAGGSYDFYRTLTVLYRAGLLITIHEGGK